jgi:hypothetical protein
VELWNLFIHDTVTGKQVAGNWRSIQEGTYWPLKIVNIPLA